MIRRPLFWVACGLVLGEAFAMVNGCWILGICLFFMAVILFSYKKENGTAAFLFQGLKLSVIFLLVMAIGYLNVYTTGVKQEFADCFETTGYGIVRGTVGSITEGDYSLQVIVCAKEITAEAGTDKVTYTGNIKVLVYLPTDTQMKPEQTITVRGEIKCPEQATNPGAFDAKSYYRNLGIFLMMPDASVEKKENTMRTTVAVWFMDFREKLADIYAACFDSENASVISAMLLGKKKQIDPEIKSLYQMNGMSHLLAISGLHIAMIGMGFFRLLRKLAGSYWICGGFTFFLILGYGYMTGMSNATARAVIMMGIVLLGKALGRSADILTSLGCACMILALLNPFVILDAGFQLSFSAIAGLGIIHPVLIRVFGGNGKIKTAIISSLSVNLAITPFIIYYYYQIPLYAILLNLVVIPLASLVIGSGILTGLFGMFSVLLGRICGIPATCILWLYETLGRFCMKLPFHTITIGHISAAMVLLYYIWLACAGYLLLRMKHSEKETKQNQARRLLGLVLAAGMVFCLPICEFQLLDREFLIVCLDVGQGDGILIRTEEGINILIDGGSLDNRQLGMYVLAPAMKYYGMGDIDYAIVSHGDSDHISGLCELLETAYTGIWIRNLVLPAYGDMGAFEPLVALANENNVPITYVDAGAELQLREGSLNCIYPGKDTGFTDTNTLSAVWKLCYQDFSMLFTGDLDETGENYLLQMDVELSCDILKVGHHGSRYSSSELFLQAVLPQIAIISAGKNNRYGHPHDETIERLEHMDCQIYQTPLQGAVIIRFRNGAIFVSGI